MDYIFPILLITVLIAINGIFVAAEFAMAGSQHTRVARMAEEGSTLAQRVLDILRDRTLINRYLSVAQIGITIATLGLGMYGEHTIAHWIEEPLESLHVLPAELVHTAALVAAVAIITYLHVVVGEMVPKSLALQAPERAAVTLNGVMTFFDRLFLPLSFVLNWCGDMLLRMVGIAPEDAASRLVSSQELEYIVAESSEGGLLRPNEQIVLENILDFQERTVSQIMTPRNRLVGVPASLTKSEALDLVCQNRFSRYPVYDEDLDHILGVLHTKDLARHFVGLEPRQSTKAMVAAADGSADSPSETLSQEVIGELAGMVRDALFVPESLALEDMLEQFQAGRSQVAIVVDEYGGVAGMVTMEDIVEELVGEIQDEYDEDEQLPFVQTGLNQVVIRGDLLLDELDQHFELEFESDEADTVAGFVMAKLGHVAQEGESVVVDGVTFTVEEMDGLAIQTLLMELPG